MFLPWFRNHPAPPTRGGKPPLVWYARVSGGEGTGNMVEDVDESRTHSVHCTPHGSPDFTTGTVALLFKPHAVPSARAATYIKFSCVLCVPWLANRKAFRAGLADNATARLPGISSWS